jgi:DNA ligase D-like protein (predicted 3'-phosphoesterase)
MKDNSRFIVVKHDAIKARLHYDLRFVMPNSKIWASFAVRKGVPEKPGVKVLAVRTHDHDEKEALFLGTIKDGYGAGKLTKFDDGKCIIHKYKSSHIIVELQGKKIKGIYHLINTGVFNRKDYKKQQFMLFKGNALSEIMGMISHIPNQLVDDTEEGPKLPWSKQSTAVINNKQVHKEHINKSKRIITAEQLYQMLKDYKL